VQPNNGVGRDCPRVQTWLGRLKNCGNEVTFQLIGIWRNQGELKGDEEVARKKRN
jgi:hypothetical protein